MLRALVFRLASLLTLLVLVTSCSSPPAAPETRAGDWRTTVMNMGGDNSKAQLTFTIAGEGRSITSFMYQHTCGGSFAETGVLNNGPWAIDENGRFTISGDDVAANGKFDTSGRRMTGTFKVSGMCSGKWRAER